MHEFMQRHKNHIKKHRPDLWINYLLTEKKYDYSRTKLDYKRGSNIKFIPEAGKGIHFDYDYFKSHSRGLKL